MEEKKNGLFDIPVDSNPIPGTRNDFIRRISSNFDTISSSVAVLTASVQAMSAGGGGGTGAPAEIDELSWSKLKDIPENYGFPITEIGAADLRTLVNQKQGAIYQVESLYASTVATENPTRLGPTSISNAILVLGSIGTKEGCSYGNIIFTNCIIFFGGETDAPGVMIDGGSTYTFNNCHLFGSEALITGVNTVVNVTKSYIETALTVNDENAVLNIQDDCIEATTKAQARTHFESITYSDLVTLSNSEYPAIKSFDIGNLVLNVSAMSSVGNVCDCDLQIDQITVAEDKSSVSKDIIFEDCDITFTSSILQYKTIDAGLYALQFNRCNIRGSELNIGTCRKFVTTAGQMDIDIFRIYDIGEVTIGSLTTGKINSFVINGIPNSPAVKHFSILGSIEIVEISASDDAVAAFNSQDQIKLGSNVIYSNNDKITRIYHVSDFSSGILVSRQQSYIGTAVIDTLKASEVYNDIQGNAHDVTPMIYRCKTFLFDTVQSITGIILYTDKIVYDENIPSLGNTLAFGNCTIMFGPNAEGITGIDETGESYKTFKFLDCSIESTGPSFCVKNGAKVQLCGETRAHIFSMCINHGLFDTENPCNLNIRNITLASVIPNTINGNTTRKMSLLGTGFIGTIEDLTEEHGLSITIGGNIQYGAGTTVNQVYDSAATAYWTAASAAIFHKPNYTAGTLRSELERGIRLIEADVITIESKDEIANATIVARKIIITRYGNFNNCNITAEEIVIAKSLTFTPAITFNSCTVKCGALVYEDTNKQATVNVNYSVFNANKVLVKKNSVLMSVSSSFVINQILETGGTISFSGSSLTLADVAMSSVAKLETPMSFGAINVVTSEGNPKINENANISSNVMIGTLVTVSAFSSVPAFSQLSQEE